MLYGLRTIEEGIIYTSRYLSDVLQEMRSNPNAFIVEIEEKPKPKRDYSKEFLE